MSCAPVRGLPPIEEVGVPPRVRRASCCSGDEPVSLGAPLRRTTRRSGHAGTIVLSALLATAAGITPLRAANPSQPPPMPATPAAAPAGDGSQPPVLANLSSLPHTVEVNLTAAPALLRLIPGKTTPGYAYNGHVPGPTLAVQEGDHVIVHFQNHLPEPTTIHWHGIHLPVEADGSPLDPVMPGARYDYVFTVQPGQSGTYWYHPHPHHRTGAQVARGWGSWFHSAPISASPTRRRAMSFRRPCGPASNEDESLMRLNG